MECPRSLPEWPQKVGGGEVEDGGWWMMVDGGGGEGGGGGGGGGERNRDMHPVETLSRYPLKHPINTPIHP